MTKKVKFKSDTITDMKMVMCLVGVIIYNSQHDRVLYCKVMKILKAFLKTIDFFPYNYIFIDVCETT